LEWPAEPQDEDAARKKFLFEDTPALDILRLAKNEGLNDKTWNFNLLFAASGDPRNMIKTVVGLPDKSYTGKCTVVLNDREFEIVARNIVLMLIAMTFEPEEAVPMMIHLWYSVLVPKPLLEKAKAAVLPRINETIGAMKIKPGRKAKGKGLTPSIPLQIKRN
jgi:hypothetical protein